jgi:hypothetical protein
MRYLLVFILCLPLTAGLFAQTIERSVIGAAGTSYSTTNLQLDFSVGEVAVSTAETGSFVLTQGFHQGDLFSVANDEPLRVAYQLFPNPTRDRVSLELQAPQLVRLRLQWVDLHGRELPQLQQQVELGTQPQTLQFDLSDLAAGTYLLQLFTQDGNEAHSFRVIRTD